MIKANDLRIGNYVMDRGKKQLKIDWFEKDKVCMNQMVGNGSVHPLTEYFEYLQPIPLTPEILEKAGFEGNALTAQHNDIIFYGDHFGIKGMLGIVKPSNVKFLHQLQNLFKCLVGVDLEIDVKNFIVKNKFL